MLGRTHIRTTAAALAIAAALPTGATAQQDLRSPDARDAAGSPVQVRQDLRSPDTRDAASSPGIVLATSGQDLRSPDARDAARPVQLPTSGPAVSPVAGPSGTSFHWGDFGIGAAATLGVVALLAGVMLVGGQRRRRTGHLPVAGAH